MAQAGAAAAPPADDLVPVQLALNGTREGAVQEWVLWPPSATEADLSDFTDSLVRDLGLQPQLKQPVTEAIAAQVTDWCTSVPPPVRGPAPRRELIRLDLVLDGSLRLRDQFWWDLHSEALTPEEFAAELCADSGVDARHGAAVAAAIRIELAKLRQAPPSNLPLPTPRIVEGKPVASSHQEAQLQSIYASSCTRAPEQWQEWGPSVHHLSLEEAQALQKQQLAAQAHQQAAAQVQQVADAQRLQAQQQVAELERMQQAVTAQQQAGAAQQQAAAAAQQQAGAAQQPMAAQVTQQVPQLVPQQAVGGLPTQGRTTVVVPSLPLPLGGQPTEQQPGVPQPLGLQQPQPVLLQQHALPTVQQQVAMRQQAAMQAAAAQQAAQQPEQQQQQQQQQPVGQQKGKKRGRGEAGGAAPGRRQLRPRRATRLAAILREEEESGSGSDDGGHSRDASRRESGPAAAGGRGHQAAHSAGSGDYQPDEDAVAAAEEAERAAWDRKGSKSKAHAKAPRRASGGAAAATPAAAAVAGPPASGPFPALPGVQGISVAVRRQPVGPGPGLAAFQQHPPPLPGMLPPAAQQPALLHMPGAGGPSLPMPSLGVMGSTSGPGMGGGIVPTIMLPGQASLGVGPVPMPLVPSSMGPKPEPPASAGVAQQLQLVAAAIVHYARELGIGEPKIQSFLACPPDEQLKLYRTLHQLVLQARSRQQQQLQAAVLAQQPQPQQPQPQLAPAMPPGHGLGPGPGPMAGVPPVPPPMGPPMPLPPMPMQLPPMPLDSMPQPSGPAGAGQYANLFSEMFD